MSKTRKGKLSVMYPDAAGIDIGSEFHYVCVPEDRDMPCIRKFGCFTSDLQQLADWLAQCHIKTIAMESTGVYWIPLFQLLEERGFEVKLVNARHVKNVPGRKSDVQDCQWLQQLHSYGLLRGSFRPEQQICTLRSYIRQRESLIRSSATHVHRMQKALTQMNIQLHKVISDMTGATGMKIIQAILEGERDLDKLASLKDYRLQKDIPTLRKSLEGDYKEEHIFSLKQEYALYQVYRDKIIECDEKIAQFYKHFDTKGRHKETLKNVKNKSRKNHPKFDLRSELYRLTGVDFTQVPGLDVLTIQTIVSEVGINPNRWPTEKHFTSWLGLSPANKITGEKIIMSKTRKVINRAALAFRLAAYAASKSQTALGGYSRRLRNRLGAPKAITATARKLACIFYRMLKYGQDYVEKGMEYYESQYKSRVIKNLQKRAHELGLVVVPTQQVEPTCCQVS